ncbi:MAG: OmpA family protein [Paludibacteraceae bacterium]|nr:OmpA family protein [Paludibacteraceae bacterium]
MKKFVYFALSVMLCTSCVPKKKYTELSEELDDCYKAKQAQNSALAANRQTIDDLESNRASLQKTIDALAKDTLNKGKSLAQNKIDLDNLKKLNKKLADQLKNSRSESEVKQLLDQLSSMQNKLQSREDSLSAKEKEMASLTAMLARQDSMMKSLKKKVSDALTNFEGKGLSVINKNGKVYVSMDNKLLFSSGSWEVGKNGLEALESIGDFLAQNKDIHVVVEGHTDNVPYTGNGYIIDNWDLSAKRATAIVRALIGNKDIDPARITASGRAEFVPLDPADTKEAKAKNRRTEIILSPNMDELMKLISNE